MRSAGHNPPTTLRCPECGGALSSRPIRLHYQLKSAHITVQRVPAKVCRRCGQELIDGHTAHHVDLLVNRVVEDLERFAKTLPLPVKRTPSVSLSV
jgi:YgiT-type zinc finger domain-containing protein